MSHLRVVTLSGREVNPAFASEVVKAIEGQDLYPVDMEALLGVTDPEHDLENMDILDMVEFLYKSNTLLGVKWGETFYFGDVDIMDMQDPSWEMESLIVQLELED